MSQFDAAPAVAMVTAAVSTQPGRIMMFDMLQIAMTLSIRCRLQDWAQNIHDEMDADKETVLLCHMGVRSMRVAGFLASQVA